MEGSRESFVQNIVLLVVTAALSGVLIPYVNARMGEEDTQRAEIEAAQKAKQASVIRAQEAYLNELEQTLFDFNMHAAAIPWYRTDQYDDVRYAAARDVYDAESWKFMGKMLVLLSKGKRLTSPPAFKKLQNHLNQWYQLDSALTASAKQQLTPQQWRALLDRVNAQADESGAVVDALAADYGLTPEGHSR